MLLTIQTIEDLNMARDIDFCLTAIGVNNKSEKISAVSNPKTRILRPGNRLSQHNSNFVNGKSHNFSSELQKVC